MLPHAPLGCLNKKPSGVTSPPRCVRTNSLGSLLTPGDVIELDLGAPSGAEAGLRRPAVVLTAQRILSGGPNVVHIVPLTSTVRESGSEVTVEPDDRNGLTADSAAQCQHVRPVATPRVSTQIGNVGAAVLQQIRDVVTTILDG